MTVAAAGLKLYSEEEQAKFRRMTVVWGITVLLLLPVLALLGYFMRLYQWRLSGNAGGMVLCGSDAAFSRNGRHVVCGLDGWCELFASKIHASQLRGFQIQLLGNAARSCAVDRLHVGWIVWNGMVFPLSPASLFAGCLGSLGYFYFFRSAGHPRGFVDHLDVGHSPCHRPALFVEDRARLELLHGNARARGTAGHTDHDRQSDCGRRGFCGRRASFRRNINAW